MRLVGSGPFWVPAMTDTDDAPEWAPSDESREQTRQALQSIDEAHRATCEACTLCGQRVKRLDGFGLCSKQSPPHAKWRSRVRAMEKAGSL